MVKYEIVLKHLFRFRNAALCCARGNYCFKDRVTIHGHYGDNIRRLSGVTTYGHIIGKQEQALHGGLQSHVVS